MMARPCDYIHTFCVRLAFVVAALQDPGLRLSGYTPA